jgi:TIR domain
LRKVFLSHAQADQDLVDHFQTLLEQGVGVAHDEIFCTSLKGLGIPAGVPDFKEYIRQEINGSELVVALISSNYYASPFCMCELGAAWVLAKNFFPILVHPIDFKDLRGALSGMQCTKLADQSSVSALYDRLHPIVAKPVSVERWETRKAVFYKNLPQVLAGIKPPEIISSDKFAEAQKKADAAVALNVELQEELDQKEKELIETRKAKSAKEIAVIRQKFSTEMEQYDNLIDECRTALAKLPSIVREALYYEVRHEEFIPKEDEFEDARAAQEDELLQPARMSDHALVPNDDRPSVRRAQAALTSLKQFLEEASHEFFDDATTTLGDTPELRRRSYWRDMDFF